MSKLLLFSSLFLLIMVIMSCKTKQIKNEANCEQMAILKNFEGLDGCSWLIVLENGDKLLPINGQDWGMDNWQDEETIRLSYKVIEDAMSICMAEQATVEITCLERIDNKLSFASTPKTCPPIDTPMSVDWMKKCVDKETPFEIQRCQYDGDSWAYVFVGKNTYLYDCHGKLICEAKGKIMNDCVKQINELKKQKSSKTIWMRRGKKE